MTVPGADGLLHLIKANPTLLPVVAEGDPGELIARRTRHEVHGCLRCPARARVALILDTEKHGRRWLDLCADCDDWLRTTAPPVFP